jgi:hypothetical protein
MLDDSRKKYEKENILSVSFLDEDGSPIAHTVNASMLIRLKIFQISINWGERIYNCVNPYYLGNQKLDEEVVTKSTIIDFDNVEKLIFKDNLTFKTAMNLTKKENIGKNKVVYSSILKDYLKSKYSVLNEFYQSIKEKRERRIHKFLNFFFYLCVGQVAALNLCTFVFFNWDVMEPITICITYLNIIGGYYYWAFTQTDYEMESMVFWLKNLNPMLKPALIDSMLREKEEIRKLLEEDVVKH